MSAPTTLADCLQDDSAVFRLTRIADVVFEIESNTRAISLSLSGLLTKTNGNIDLIRDLLAAKQSADQLTNWLGLQYKGLTQRLQQLDSRPEGRSVAPHLH